MPGNFLHMLMGARVVQVGSGGDVASFGCVEDGAVLASNSIDCICEKVKGYWPVYICGNSTGKGPLNLHCCKLAS